MKVLIKQFFGGKNHSWFHCGIGIATALKQLGHELHIFSTDGIKYLPHHLKENLMGYTEENQPKVYGRMPDNDYEMAISYTCLKNFGYNLSPAKKNRFGIWIYEWISGDGKNVLPNGFAKHYKECDFLCTPSNFGKRIFVESGIPESIIKVIPHGINVEEYQQTTTMKLPTNKKFKILANIAQNHLRKNIPGLLEAYGKAFTKKDDVCLILKAKDKKVTQQFEVSLSDCISQFHQKYPNHAEFHLLDKFVEDMSELYRSIDCVYTMTHCEGYYMPASESLAAGKMNIAPAFGGQLDFLNDTNSLFIKGDIVRANPKSMYWESKPNATWYKPSIDDAVDKLRYAYNNFESINKEVEKQRPMIFEKYNWGTVTKQFLELCQ